MDKNVLKSVMSDNMAEIPKYGVNPRNIRFEEAGNYVFVGMRRAGKSYLLYQRIQELLANGVKPHEMLYIAYSFDIRPGFRATSDQGFSSHPTADSHRIRPSIR